MKSGGMLIPLLFVIEIVLSAGCIANPFAANQSGKYLDSVNAMMDKPTMPDEYVATPIGTPKSVSAAPETLTNKGRLLPILSGQNTTISGTGLGNNTNSTNIPTINGSVVSIPVAQFTSDVAMGFVPLTVQFTDTSLNLPVIWAWNFGDGGSSALQNPAHTYYYGGQYTVGFTATNVAGSNFLNASNYALVYAPGFTAFPDAGAAPLTVTFTDAGAGYPQPTSWYWDFGDNSTRGLRNSTHQYTVPGTYDVKLRITSAAGTAWTNHSAAVTVT